LHGATVTDTDAEAENAPSLAVTVSVYELGVPVIVLAVVISPVAELMTKSGVWRRPRRLTASE
jgi:hypothetical protein